MCLQVVSGAVCVVRLRQKQANRHGRRLVNCRRRMTSSDSSETISDGLIIDTLEDNASTAAERVRLEALPKDLLAAIVAFADLKTLGAGVAVCRALRSASERLSPRLEKKKPCSGLGTAARLGHGLATRGFG